MSDSASNLYLTAQGWLAAGHGVAIATVTKTWGSAPRRQGAHLLIRDDGLFEGSVSGGCVEGDVVVAAGDVIASNTPKRLHYGVADAKAWEVGLACGGEIDILVQPLTDAGFPPALLDDIIAARSAGKSLDLFTDEESRTTTAASAGAFKRSYMPPLELLLVGAVHISQALIPIARTLEYRVRLVDPRGDFAAGARFSGLDIDTRWPD
ncbi:MAG: XdhC family protein, partial [Pacificimonas sp.]